MNSPGVGQTSTPVTNTCQSYSCRWSICTLIPPKDHCAHGSRISSATRASETGLQKTIVFFLLVTLLACCGALRAQTFNLITGREPVASLNGLWRFHTGDNIAWADPNFNDSGWALLRSDSSWSNQGYQEYSGFAWYRFQVTVPDSLDRISLYLPEIYTCYQVYANGSLIGTYGKMPPNAGPYGGGGRFQIFALPVSKDEGNRVEIALRVWHWPGWGMYKGGGPSYGGGLVGDSSFIAQRGELEWAQVHWSQASFMALGSLQMLAGLGALALFLLRRKEKEYLWFSLMMFFGAVFAARFITVSDQIYGVKLHEFVRHSATTGSVLASIAFFWTLLQPRRTWLLKLAVISVLAQLLAYTILDLPVALLSVWLTNLIAAFLWLPYYAWVVWVVVARARQNSIDARLLVAPVILSTSANLFGNAAWVTYTLGWQRQFALSPLVIIKPFPIELVQVTDALFLLAVFAILILRFTRTRSAAERFAGEVQAARSVQQFLIPEHLPSTPGLSIESEYRPAREVGGDFFQVLPNDADGSTLIVVGDVAGHGMEAGMLATLIVGAIRTAAAFTTDPGRILSLLNERMQGRGLATCLAVRIEKDGRAVLANAGHLPPYLNGKEVAMEGALPLGAVAGVEFPVLNFRLNESDSLMLMTDGVAEAQDADGRLFGFERIAEMLRRGTVAAGLANAAQTFGQEDDITVLTVARATALE
jgi:phosphoserine phosphatase RsbU/P